VAGRADSLDISVIIPVAPGADAGPAMRAALQGIPRGLRAEVLTVDGTHPSRQRNLAANRARGRVLWFLDHDAVAAPETARRLLAAMREFGAAVAGGPNAATPARSWVEAAAVDAIGSPLGSPLVSARYGSRAVTGPAGERDLILCNLAIDREAFLAAGGFDPRLYPNEENALLNDLKRRGRSAVHVHDALVVKPRPATIGRFLHESFRYGCGRMEQIWIAAAPGDAVFLAALVAGLGALAASFRFPWIPGVYAAICAAESLRIVRARGSGSLPGAGVCASFIIMRHGAYGLGMCWGALSGWRKRRLRWIPMRATLRRWDSRGMRLQETVSCRIGSMDQGGAGECLRKGNA